MVVTYPTDPDQITRLCKEYFYLNAHQLDIDADGTVNVPKYSVRSQKLMRQMPVKFGHVQGMFDVSGSGLITLAGCPHTVDHGFYARDLQISDLTHAPQTVNYKFWCQGNHLLTSLKGAPSELPDAEFVVTYHPDLGVLRLLQYPDWYIQKAPDKLVSILNSYKGEGKKAMLNCALELKKQGFEGNAKW